MTNYCDVFMIHFRVYSSPYLSNFSSNSYAKKKKRRKKKKKKEKHTELLGTKVILSVLRRRGRK